MTRTSPITIDEIGGDDAGFFVASGFSTSPIDPGESTNFFMRPASEDSPVGVYDLTIGVFADGGFSAIEFPVTISIIAPPEIVEVRRSGGDTVLEVEPNGSQYFVQFSPDLIGGWGTLTTLGTFNGGAVVIPESLAPGESGFFRLVQE